jgi:hypothetical protein
MLPGVADLHHVAMADCVANEIRKGHQTVAQMAFEQRCKRQPSYAVAQR